MQQIPDIMNIAYFGYDFFHETLRTIIDSNFNVKWLYTHETDNIISFNKQVLKYASEKAVKIFFHKPKISDIRQLKNEGCDLLLSAGYAYKIPVSEGSPFGVNIHPSLLPYGRGVWPIPCVILKNITVTGITFHQLNNKFDQGDILFQKEIIVSPSETLESLSYKHKFIAKSVIIEFLENLDSYKKLAVPQHGGTYWDCPSIEDRSLSWNSSIYEIDKISRAFGKLGTIATIDSGDWVVNNLVSWKEFHRYKIGTIVSKSKGKIVIAVKDGFVSLKKISPFVR